MGITPKLEPLFSFNGKATAGAVHWNTETCYSILALFIFVDWFD